MLVGSPLAVIDEYVNYLVTTLRVVMPPGRSASRYLV